MFDENLIAVVMYRDHLAYDKSKGDGASELRPTLASASVMGKMKGDQLVEAHDCEIATFTGDTKCARQIRPGKFRPEFVYDLKTR